LNFNHHFRGITRVSTAPGDIGNLDFKISLENTGDFLELNRFSWKFVANGIREESSHRNLAPFQLLGSIDDDDCVHCAPKKEDNQTYNNNSVKSQQITKILSLAHWLVNL